MADSTTLPIADPKPYWCPADLWLDTGMAFDQLYDAEPDLEGGCEVGIRTMAARMVMEERERCAKVCEAVGSDLDPQYADHIAAWIRSGSSS